MGGLQERAADVHELVGAFEGLYARPPDGVWAAPGRVNVIGEHTDYNEGLVLPIAIDRQTLAAVAPRDDAIVRVASRQRQGDPVVRELSDLGPGRVRGWAAYPLGVAWSLADGHGVSQGADVLVDSRVPLGAGLSSSAALEAAVGLALTEVVRSRRPARRFGPGLPAGRKRGGGRADRRHGPDGVFARPGGCGAVPGLPEPADRAGALRFGRRGPGAAGHRHPRLARSGRRGIRRPACRLRGGGPPDGGAGAAGRHPRQHRRPAGAAASPGPPRRHGERPRPARGPAAAARGSRRAGPAADGQPHVAARRLRGVDPGTGRRGGHCRRGRRARGPDGRRRVRRVGARAAPGRTGGRGDRLRWSRLTSCADGQHPFRSWSPRPKGRGEFGSSGFGRQGGARRGTRLSGRLSVEHVDRGAPGRGRQRQQRLVGVGARPRVDRG